MLAHVRDLNITANWIHRYVYWHAQRIAILDSELSGCQDIRSDVAEIDEIEFAASNHL